MNRARYYDPRSGRFLSEDPIGFKGSDYNFYRLGLGNPVKFRDPSGNTPIAIAFVAAGASSGAITGFITGFAGSDNCSVSGKLSDAFTGAALGALGGAIAGIGVATGSGIVGTAATLFGGSLAGSGTELIGVFGF